MGKVNGGELVVRVLESAGVRELFVLHGGHLDAILQAAHDHEFRLIDTRHEQAAAHAADGWARTTGRLGVAVCTAGPGITDAVTGVTNAYLDCSPMLLIGGAAPLRDAEKLPLQGGFDQVALFTPITKWAHQVTHTERIPELLARAIRVATEGRPGPVYLEIPIDVLFSNVDEERVEIPTAIGRHSPPAPAPAAIAQTIDWLHEAERPIIIAGGGAFCSGASAALRSFAEHTHIPVFANPRANGLVPADHPLCGGGVGNLAGLRMAGLELPDAVLLLGARIGLFTGGQSGAMLPHDARLVQVDICAEELGRNRELALGIAADCNETLLALQAAASNRSWPDRQQWLGVTAAVREGHRALFAEALTDEKPPIHPYRLASAIADVVEPDAIIVADGGETASWMQMTARINEPGHFLTHGYLGCLGTGMPFAIAAKLAHPDKQVVCIVGDGSVGLNFSEFDTMVRHQLDIVVVVNNDQQWGMSAHGQDILFGSGRRVATDLHATRYDQAAAGFGCRGELVEQPADLVPALQAALASDRPSCINVMTDRSVIAPVTLAMLGRTSPPSDQKGGKDTVTIPYYDDLEG